MAELSSPVDWDAIRAIAYDCMNATWDLVCEAEWSNQEDNDEDRSQLYLGVIENAGATFKRASITAFPGTRRLQDATAGIREFMIK